MPVKLYLRYCHAGASPLTAIAADQKAPAAGLSAAQRAGAGSLQILERPRTAAQAQSNQYSVLGDELEADASDALTAAEAEPELQEEAMGWEELQPADQRGAVP